MTIMKNITKPKPQKPMTRMQYWDQDDQDIGYYLEIYKERCIKIGDEVIHVEPDTTGLFDVKYIKETDGIKFDKPALGKAVSTLVCLRISLRERLRHARGQARWASGGSYLYTDYIYELEEDKVKLEMLAAQGDIKLSRYPSKEQYLWALSEICRKSGIKGRYEYKEKKILEISEGAVQLIAKRTYIDVARIIKARSNSDEVEDENKRQGIISSMDTRYLYEKLESSNENFRNIATGIFAQPAPEELAFKSAWQNAMPTIANYKKSK